MVALRLDSVTTACPPPTQPFAPPPQPPPPQMKKSGYATENLTKTKMRFLGMVGYYRRYCPKFSEIVTPLTDLMGKKVKLFGVQPGIEFDKPGDPITQ